MASTQRGHVVVVRHTSIPPQPLPVRPPFSAAKLVRAASPLPADDRGVLIGAAVWFTVGLLLVGGRAEQPGGTLPFRSALHAASREGEPRAGELGVGPSGYALRFVPAASFVMGSPEDEPGHGEHEVQHPVVLSAGVWIGETEVSQALWTQVTGGLPGEAWSQCAGRVGPELPMTCVTWCDAVRFANALSRRDGLTEAYPGGCDANAAVTWDRTADGYRLPTEAEWEWAARGGQSGGWGGPGGVCARGNIADASAAGLDLREPCTDGFAEAAPVGSETLRANDYGLRDMVGNVWEWTWDWYDAYPAAGIDPEGPAYRPPVFAARVYRGGAWDSPAADARVASRFAGEPTYAGSTLGFRLARSHE